jgi:uncharacterized membrane protein
MKYIAQRLFVMGVLFLLAPVWIFPFIDEITLLFMNQRLRAENLTLLGYDRQRFPMEFGTFHYLYIIGVWVTIVSIFLHGIIKLREKMKKRRLEKPD